jgi:hypothetical protein
LGKLDNQPPYWRNHGKNASGVKKSLALFGTLLGYQELSNYLGLEHIVCYGVSASGPDNDPIFGPLVLYRPDDNTLAWINESLSQSDSKKMEFFSLKSSKQMCWSSTGVLSLCETNKMLVILGD